MITQSGLKEKLHYDEGTGLFTWLEHINKNNQKGGTAGTQHSEGYVQITINGRLYLAHRLVWLFKYGYFPENGLDHVDRYRSHNWISNLREVSGSCNIRNTGNFSSNTSGVKGVSYCKTDKRWVAKVGVHRKHMSVGRSIDFVEAVAHRLAAEQCLNWEGCDSCSPAFQYMQTYLKDLKCQK